MTATATKPQMGIPAELMEQAIETYEAALKSGVKVQEEFAKWCADLLTGMGPPQEWQKKMREATLDALPLAQKNVQEAVQMMNQNAETSMKLLKSAFEAAQSQSAQETQAKTTELWEASLAALRKNTQAVIQANAKAVESWADLARKGAAEQAKQG